MQAARPQCCGKAKQPRGAIELLAEMLQKDLAPGTHILRHTDVITYRVVISACGKCEMPERALHPFKEMQQQGLEPNVITYTTVIGAGELTLQFFDEMRQQGLQPKVVTFSTVVSACRNCKLPQRCSSRDLNPM